MREDSRRPSATVPPSVVPSSGENGQQGGPVRDVPGLPSGRTTVYLDYPIHRRDGYLTIHRPDGRVLLAGRISVETAHRMIRRDRGEWSR